MRTSSISKTALPPAEKERARGSLSEIVAELRAARLAAALFVRVNAARSADAARDFAAALDLPIDGIVVPKLAERADVRAAEAAIARAEDRTGRHLGAIALIETAIGVTNVDRLAAYWRARLVALAFGAEDFVTDIGGRRRTDSREVLYARSRVVLSARANGIAALDQVFPWIQDSDGFVTDARVRTRPRLRGQDVHHAEAGGARERRVLAVGRRDRAEPPADPRVR